MSSAESSSSGDEDEKPLASQRAEKRAAHPPRVTKGKKVGRKGGKGGKGMASMKSKAHTAPIALPPPTEQERKDMTHPASNGVNGHGIKVKVEDKMDEGQLDRLATGVTVDAGGAPSSTAVGHCLLYICHTF